MIMDALRVYSDRKPRFEVDEEVYLHIKNEVSGPFKIEYSGPNKLGVFMYSFYGSDATYGEMYLKSDPNDEPLSLSDCFPDESGIAEEIISSAGKLNGTRGINGGLALEFFQPDQTFIKWIKEYAGNRLIVDVGCGSGRTLLRLMEAGARACGIDPYWDDQLGLEMNMERITSGKEMVQVLGQRIEEVPELYQGKGNRVLLLFARPCHSAFVYNVLKTKDADTEVLYITIPQNMTKYNDLGSFQDKAKLLKHEGWSVQSEQVYSII